MPRLQLIVSGVTLNDESSGHRILRAGQRATAASEMFFTLRQHDEEFVSAQPGNGVLSRAQIS